MASERKTNVARFAKRYRPTTVSILNDKPRSEMSVYELVQMYRKQDPSLRILFDSNWLFERNSNKREIDLREKNKELFQASIDAMVILYYCFKENKGLAYQFVNDLYIAKGANFIEDRLNDDYDEDEINDDLASDVISNLVFEEPTVPIVCLNDLDIFRADNIHSIIRNINDCKYIDKKYKDIFIDKLDYAKKLFSYFLVDDEENAINTSSIYEPKLWRSVWKFM